MISPSNSCLTKGKECPLLVELNNLWADLNKSQLRYQRPSKFVFFCGGVNPTSSNSFLSMRHYLMNVSDLETKIGGHIVLAERATQLYRDTDYEDLISFEEDIATISSAILLISESAGSLAELGAFSSILNTRQALTVAINESHYNQESFVRYGPIKRLEDQNTDSVIVIPWRTKKDGTLIKSSAKAHTKAIIDFFRQKISAMPQEALFNLSSPICDFILIYWILYLGQALAIVEIQNISELLDKKMEIHEIKNKLYCMKIANWVTSFKYINKTYWCIRHDVDPFTKYSFNSGVKNVDPNRRKALATAELRRNLSIPAPVGIRAVNLRLRP